MPDHYIAENLNKNNDWLYGILNECDMSFPAFENKYLLFLKKTKHSKNTVKANAYQISYYLNYLSQIKISHEDVLAMDYEDQFMHFTDYLLWLSLGEHSATSAIPCNSTCNNYLGKVFGFYKYIVNKGLVSGDIRVLDERTISIVGNAGVRKSKCISTFSGYLEKDGGFRNDCTLSRDDVITLVSTENNIRNKLLLLILADTGIRIGEALGIKYSSDIDLDNRKIKVVYRDDNENDSLAKNAEFREVCISEETCELLIHYLVKYNNVLKKSDYLFISLSGKNAGSALGKGSVYKFMDRLERKTGIRIRPHMLRHYFANERRKMGTKIDLISYMLGHKHISTTEEYFNVEMEETLKVQEEYFKSISGLIDVDSLVG